MWWNADEWGTCPSNISGDLCPSCKYKFTDLILNVLMHKISINDFVVIMCLVYLEYDYENYVLVIYYK